MPISKSTIFAEYWQLPSVGQILERGRQSKGPSDTPDAQADRMLSQQPFYNREERMDLDSDWVHDRFDEQQQYPRRRPSPYGFEQRPSRRRREEEDYGTKLRVDNIHYDLTEDELRGLFERKGPVRSVRLMYDRQDRSEGTAFVTYDDARDARAAMADFDGQNANGQPISITIVPTGPVGRARERPQRSLFERMDLPRGRNIDRYVPRKNFSRSRSPLRRPRGGRGHGRNQGQERRPMKTEQELDAEMADYWDAANSKPQDEDEDMVL
ncbi:RNA-binding domain-containing protein [Piedraia hortae CBS 480.64]|uniref:RNA-binding domain-containing protein n=1 Tax=Piedraia hortae CBS 480.64 TaxID=1314780 RepID=A0A6A7BVC3_9PEZI|nr:RNA-binding domain-containing protein [Piedraia hortae CBS 480.64]